VKFRLFKVILLAALLLVSLPLSAMAESTNVTLKDVANKVQGNSLTVEGTTSFEEILIKVLRPNSTVFYYDVIIPDADGKYSASITLPSNAEVGTYTIVAGKGTDVVTSQFNVSANNPGPGGGGGGGMITPPTNTPNTATVQVALGGTVTLNGVTISFPAGVLGSDIKVTVENVDDPSKLPIDALQRLVSAVYEITKDKDGQFDKTVSIILPFDKSKVELEKVEIKMYWLNETTGKWIPLDNQQIDFNKGTISGTVNHFTKFAVIATEKQQEPTEPEVVLTDIKGHWAEATIVELIKLGAISGYPDHTFKPNNNITRSEFVSILVKAFQLESTNGKVYADTANHWAKTAISTAAELGIVNGYSETTFGPNDPITREQMAVMIVKAAKLPLVTEGKTFKDSSDISGWAAPSVDTATSNGLISGYDGSLRPKGNATRAEAATVILKAISIK